MWGVANFAAGFLPGGFIGLIFTTSFLLPMRCIDLLGRPALTFGTRPPGVRCTNWLGTDFFNLVNTLSTGAALFVGALVGTVISVVIGALKRSVHGAGAVGA